MGDWSGQLTEKCYLAGSVRDFFLACITMASGYVQFCIITPQTKSVGKQLTLAHVENG